MLFVLLVFVLLIFSGWLLNVGITLSFFGVDVDLLVEFLFWSRIKLLKGFCSLFGVSKDLLIFVLMPSVFFDFGVVFNAIDSFDMISFLNFGLFSILSNFVEYLLDLLSLAKGFSIFDNGGSLSFSNSSTIIGMEIELDED